MIPIYHASVAYSRQPHHVHGGPSVLSTEVAPRITRQWRKTSNEEHRKKKEGRSRLGKASKIFKSKIKSCHHYSQGYNILTLEGKLDDI